MRVMVIVKASAESEASVMPGEELLTAMGAYNEALMQAGIMLGGEGLKPSSAAKRMIIAGDERRVVDGPFAETKELIAGFWMWEVKSMDEAVEWARRMPSPQSGHTEVDIRPIFSAEDFGEAFTPELQAQEERMREELAKRGS